MRSPRLLRSWFIAKQELITRTSFVYKTSQLVRNSLLISILKKQFCFFHGTATENFFPVFAWPDINTRGAGRNLDGRKPSTLSRICITALNSSNPSPVKHGKRFLLLTIAFLEQYSAELAIPAFFSRNIVVNIAHFCYLQCSIASE